MKNLLALISLLFSFQGLFTHAEMIGTANILFPDGIQLGCDTDPSQKVVNSTSITIPPGATSLTIVIDDMWINKECDVPGSAKLLIATHGDEETDSLRHIVEFLSDGDNKFFVFPGGDVSNPDSYFSIWEVDSIFNQSLTFAATLDWKAGRGDAALSISKGLFNSKNQLKKIYFPEIEINSTLKIEICPNVDCKIRNLRVLFSYFPSVELLVMGISPIIIGSYEFKEGTGVSTSSSISTLEAATFSNNTPPTWLPSGEGLGFTNRNQFITIPTFPIQSVNNRPSSLSMGVSFWIKLDEFARNNTTPDFIFHYTMPDLKTHRFSLSASNTGQLGVHYAAQTDRSSETFQLGKWTLVTASFSLLASESGLMFYRTAYFGNTQVISPDFGILYANNFLNSDIIRVGGFIGQIATFKIMTPASLVLNSPSFSPSCALDMGIMSSPLCIQPGCYAACPLGCNFCSDANTCQQCLKGYALEGPSCLLSVHVDQEEEKKDQERLLIILLSVIGAISAIGTFMYVLYLRRKRMSKFKTIPINTKLPMEL